MWCDLGVCDAERTEREEEEEDAQSTHGRVRVVCVCVKCVCVLTHTAMCSGVKEEKEGGGNQKGRHEEEKSGKA